MSKSKEAELIEANHFSEYAKSETSVPMDDETALLTAARKKNKVATRPAVAKQTAFLEFKVEEMGRALE